MKKQDINKKSILYNNGITLIALVITIIILIILSAVTIALTLGDNGIVDRAERAKAETRYTSAKEILSLKLMEVQTKCITDEKEYTIEEIESELRREQVDNILIEQYFNSNTAKIKSDVQSNLIKLTGIVVSVEDYSEYKFLIGRSCNLEAVALKDADITNEQNFTEIEKFEKDIFGNTIKVEVSEEYIYITENMEGKLDVKENQVLVINEGVEFTVTQNSVVLGKVINNGTLKVNDNISLDIQSIASFENNGTISCQGEIINNSNKTPSYLGQKETRTIASTTLEYTCIDTQYRDTTGEIKGALYIANGFAGGYIGSPEWSTCSGRQTLNSGLVDENNDGIEDTYGYKLVNTTVSKTFSTFSQATPYAFTQEDYNQLQVTDTYTGNVTQDFVFVLSVEEAVKYSKYLWDLNCDGTLSNFGDGGHALRTAFTGDSSCNFYAGGSGLLTYTRSYHPNRSMRPCYVK